MARLARVTPSNINYGNSSEIIVRRRPRFPGLSFVVMLVLALGLGGYIGFRFWYILRVSRFFTAAGTGDVVTVEKFLRKGLSPNQTDVRSGQTILMYAAQFGQAEIVWTLLRHGANPNLSYSGGPGIYFHGRTALMYAVESGATPSGVFVRGQTPSSVIQLLVEAGADVNAREHFGETPLVFALERAQPAAATYLLEHGANPNVANRFGEPALTVAIETSQIPTVLLMVEKGADVNACDDRGPKKPAMARPPARSRPGDTPLITALKAKKPELIPVLLSRGARLDVTNRDGATVWTLATDPELLRLLKEGKK